MKSHPKDRNLEPILHVSTCVGFLTWSQNFLSAIFGILGKFRIDIGENYFQKNIFFETKNFSRKKSEKFSDFSETVFVFGENFENFPKFCLKNRKFSKIFEIFENFGKLSKIFIENLRKTIFLKMFAKKFWSRKNIF